ncbi:hypothetical protein DB345_18905 [Spartobacteria bacterium LR76]|nr:hypothetical protein DB345_18905 [Spartobacteria bacterium LR76]
MALRISPLVLGITLSLAAAFGLRAQDLRRPPTPADRQQFGSAGWPAARDQLQAALLAAYAPGGSQRPGSTGVTAFKSWLLLWKWADLLAQPEQPFGTQTADFQPAPDAKTNADLLDPTVVRDWISDEAFGAMLFSTLSPEDNATQVLKNLQDIAQASPAKFREYPALAIALAVVYDVPLPPYWPHHQVTQSLIPITNQSAAERFAYWSTANDAHDLLLDIRKLDPEQLKFLIDAPIDPAEFAWARKRVRLSRNEMPKAFSMIRYDRERLLGQQYSWTEGPYTLEEIYSKGGICVDQAYFASMVGKARGLPTLYFSGQGVDGGHAWFGYMKMDDKWELDCGRYENQNYATGEALDPQTWTPISDHELQFLAKRFRDTPLYAASQDDIMFAELFLASGQNDRALRAADSAISVCPENPDAWNEKTRILEKTQASLPVLRTHLEAAAKQFTSYRDLRVDYQVALAKVARAQGDSTTADTLERLALSQNKKKRSDLSVGIAADRLSSLVEQKQFDEAFKEYKKQINGLGKTGGGNFFYDIVEPFAMALKGAGDDAKAENAVALARKALRPEPGGILDVDMKQLENAISAKAGN